MDKQEILKKINAQKHNTMMEWMDIEFTDFTGDTLTAEMAINKKVHQPYGILHGGASAVLAETVGSLLSAIQYPIDKYGAVGTNLNVYHLKSIKAGKVIAKGSFIRKGNSLHVLRIDICDQDDNAICYAILTTKIIELKK